MDISIAICTYNGENRLSEVLDSLMIQENTKGIRWEVLVVDNNSSDETARLVETYQQRWPTTSTLRYAFEPMQGKSNAVRLAVTESQGICIGFLDDDNLPNVDWISAASSFAESHPKAGAFGGRVLGKFDCDLPKSFGLVKNLFAINERQEECCYNKNGALEFGAPGAGLIVRRNAWCESVPPAGLTRSGPSGAGRGTLGEEFELQWRLHETGWEVWHNPKMVLWHHIDNGRLTPEYLDGFFRSIGLSRHAVRMLRRPAWQRPFATIGFLFSDAFKYGRLRWRYRDRSKTDPFVRGRLQMLKCMLLRPFLFDRSSQE